MEKKKKKEKNIMYKYTTEKSIQTYTEWSQRKLVYQA